MIPDQKHISESEQILRKMKQFKEWAQFLLAHNVELKYTSIKSNLGIKDPEEVERIIEFTKNQQLEDTRKQTLSLADEALAREEALKNNPELTDSERTALLIAMAENRAKDKQPPISNTETRAVQENVAQAKTSASLERQNTDSKHVKEVNQIEADALLAQKEQEKEDAARRAKLAKQAEEDALLAAKEQQADTLLLLLYNQKRLSTEETDQRLKAHVELQDLLKSPAVRGENQSGTITDAHKHTRTEIRNGLPIVLQIDDKFKLSNSESKPVLSVAEIQKEVIEFVSGIPANTSPPNIDNIKRTLALVIAAPNPVEAQETNANIPQLLARTWSLAKLLGPGAKGEIAQVLHLNIADQGSCMAGLAARLYSPYVRNLHHLLELQLGIAPENERLNKLTR